MISMAITVLLYLMLTALLVQPNKDRFIASSIFVFAIMIHEWTLSNQTGLVYYGTAGLFDLIVITMLHYMKSESELVWSLINISFVSMITNTIGWIMWMLWIPPTLYNAAFVVIYGWAFFKLIGRDKKDVGGHSLDRWYSGFRINNNPGNVHIRKREGEA